VGSHEGSPAGEFHSLREWTLSPRRGAIIRSPLWASTTFRNRGVSTCATRMFYAASPMGRTTTDRPETSGSGSPNTTPERSGTKEGAPTVRIGLLRKVCESSRCVSAGVLLQIDRRANVAQMLEDTSVATVGSPEGTLSPCHLHRLRPHPMGPDCIGSTGSSLLRSTTTPVPYLRDSCDGRSGSMLTLTMKKDNLVLRINYSRDELWRSA